MKSIDANIWFAAVDRVAPFWTRRGIAEGIVLMFDGYKTEEAYNAEAELMKLGGFCVSMDFDKISGKTLVFIREPNLIREDETE